MSGRTHSAMISGRPAQNRTVQALAYNAGAAGFVLLSMINFILIIILGFDKDAGTGTSASRPLLDAADNA